MTSDPETFRKGATAYRNAGGWTKKKRDETIERVNKRVNDQPGILTVDASFSGVSGFTSLDETDTIQALSQESQTSLNKSSNTTADSPKSEISTDELVLGYTLSVKRVQSENTNFIKSDTIF